MGLEGAYTRSSNQPRQQQIWMTLAPATGLPGPSLISSDPLPCVRAHTSVTPRVRQPAPRSSLPELVWPESTPPQSIAGELPLGSKRAQEL